MSSETETNQESTQQASAQNTQRRGRSDSFRGAPRRRRDDRPARDNNEKMSVLSVRRVAKVRDGGKRLSYSVLVAVGDGQGRLGLGTGSSSEITSAIQRATLKARKYMKTVSLYDSRTLKHDVSSHYCATTVIMRKAPLGRGIVAGKVIKAMMECLGGEKLDIVSKVYGSRNPHNVSKAVMMALSGFIKPVSVSQ